MDRLDRRQFLRLGGAGVAVSMFPAVIREALAVPADARTRSIMDVQHVVILMQENRSFDHYFGTLRGVRGFGDRFTVPMGDGRSVWEQQLADGTTILPYHLDATMGNAQRVDGTPHGWSDAHAAWNKGRFGHWPQYKEPQSMGYFERAELSFQFALAEAFTLCDAYHCSIQTSTNPNRLFMFTGTNNPGGVGGGPAIDNTNDDLGAPASGYQWTTYAERLEAAGVSWKVYQDMDNNFTDNSLEGFTSFRNAYYNEPDSPLLKGVSTTLTNNDLEGLKADVLSGALPQVSWIVGPDTYSEHPGPSSPVQGGWYMQAVLEALTADPAVWSRTVLLVMFDENDGFFDHLPPPAAPSLNDDGSLAGASTVDDSTERHSDGQVYGPGPRVPMLIVSPWSVGGWVNSQVFDHTSILRFLEARFGVAEPNISAWRRAVCGDLTSAFNFRDPNGDQPQLPAMTQSEADAIRAAQEQLPQVPVPTGSAGTFPVQESGMRPSRALPYQQSVDASVDPLNETLSLLFTNRGSVAVVLQVYDRGNPDAVPRRYTVEAGKQLSDDWAVAPGSSYALWVLGPNGFHRHFQGSMPASNDAARPEIRVLENARGSGLELTLRNDGSAACTFTVTPNAYLFERPWTVRVAPGRQQQIDWRLHRSGRWYDFTVTSDGEAGFSRRFAGRVENGVDSVTDPAMGKGG